MIPGHTGLPENKKASQHYEQHKEEMQQYNEISKITVDQSSPLRKVLLNKDFFFIKNYAFY
jgi:hypothetical protein